jgi:hypothetical protein
MLLQMKTKWAAPILALVSTGAFATTDWNKTVDRLGTQLATNGTGSWAYFNLKEGFSVNCPGGFAYVDITTDFGRAAFASLLAARSSGRLLSRIDYGPTGTGGNCIVSIVEVED